MLYQIKKITVENERKLHIYYANGGSIIVDFNPIIETGGILASLPMQNFLPKFLLARMVDTFNGLEK